MNIYPLIFSNNNNYRISRHAIFWLIWIAYYTIFSTYGFRANLPFANRFFSSLTEVTLSTPMDMLFCYAIIYFLLPRFLFKGRYVSMILLWLLFSVIFIAVFEVYVAEAVPHIRSWFGLPKPMRHSSYDYIFFSLFSQINMEGCMAAAIKLGKISFINQKEIDLLRNEKVRLQTQTDKAELQPVFLADIITRVELMATKKPMKISDALKKINILVTNIIYENTNAKISIKRELELISEYIDLEQYTREKTIEVKVSVSGDIETEKIASFILLQCVQNAFSQVSDLNIDNKKIEIKLNVTNKILEVIICWNKPLFTSTLSEGKNIIPRNLSNRLKLIYPESHEIKALIEVETVVLCLKIDLKGAII